MATEVDEVRDLAVLSVFAEFGPHAGPSVRDIRSKVGWSIETVQRVVRRLTAVGDLVNADPWKDVREGSRAAGSLRISQQGKERLLRALPSESELDETVTPSPTWPIVGELAAGTGVDVMATLAEGLTLLEVLQPDSQDQVFTVRGRSMINAGIQDGDYVVIRRIDTIEDVRPQDMVVVIVNKAGAEETTLKYLQRTPDGPRLVPANLGGVDWQGNKYRAETYAPDQVTIIGVLRWRIGGPVPDVKATLPSSPVT